jgi:hypothetical protein
LDAQTAGDDVSPNVTRPQRCLAHHAHAVQSDPAARVMVTRPAASSPGRPCPGKVGLCRKLPRSGLVFIDLESAQRCVHGPSAIRAQRQRVKFTHQGGVAHFSSTFLEPFLPTFVRLSRAGTTAAQRIRTPSTQVQGRSTQVQDARGGEVRLG